VLKPRLGLETLDLHGDFNLGSPEQSVLDCRSKGSKMVMIGIDGNHGEAIDRIRVLCSPIGPGANTADVPTPGGEWGTSNGAAPFERKCDDNQAVIGIAGTTDGLGTKVLRGLRIRCQAVTAEGLTIGPIFTKDVVGKWVGSTWPQDDCSDGRPARSIKVARDYFTWPKLLSIMFISGIQMRCEQPEL
jgi:hypothetical protein